MGFKKIIGDVATTAGTLAKSAAKRAGEVAESTKLNITLKSEQHKLEGMFTTLGKLFYEQAKGTDVRAQIVAQIMEIDEQKQVIGDLRTILVEAGGKVICSSCGKGIDIEDVYCPICGKKQEPKLMFGDFDSGSTISDENALVPDEVAAEADSE